MLRVLTRQKLGLGLWLGLDLVLGLGIVLCSGLYVGFLLAIELDHIASLILVMSVCRLTAYNRSYTRLGALLSYRHFSLNMSTTFLFVSPGPEQINEIICTL